MRLNHNLMSLNVYRSYSKNLNSQSKVMSRMCTGYKVNRAGDDPNALAQMESIKLQIRGTQMAQKNMQDGVSMLQTAESGLDNISESMIRIRELMVKAGGAVNSEDKTVIQNEINEMVSHIRTTSQNTEFNGVNLIAENNVLSNDNPKYLHMASGSNVGEEIDIPLFNLKPELLKGGPANKSLVDIDVTKNGGVDEGLLILDGALDMVLSVRNKYGALENRLDSTYNTSGSNLELSERALSSKGDVDVAEEMMGLAKYNILIEAGNAMMTQTNRFPQDILRILERVK